MYKPTNLRHLKRLHAEKKLSQKPWVKSRHRRGFSVSFCNKGFMMIAVC